MKRILSVLLATIMVLSLVACGGGTKEEPKAEEPKTEQPTDTKIEEPVGSEYAEWVYIGMEKDLDTADPYGGTTAMTEWFTTMTFDTVIYNNPETGEIDPELAYKWEPNADNTEWTFYLEEDVYFHNGDHMTAEDVKFTYLYAANLNGETNVVKTFSAGTYAKEVEVVDDYTIKFILNSPMPDFAAYMEMKVYSKNAIETLGHADGSVIGTGAYYYDKDESVSGQMFVATRNEDYWQGTDAYKTKHIATKVYGDTNSTAAALQAGEIDMTFTLPPTDYPILSTDPNLQTEVKTGCQSYYLGFNYKSTNVDMNDVEIRRAIVQCIDKDAMLEIAWEGFAEKSMNFCAPSGLGYSADTKGIEYNPEAGAATLKEKGVKDLIIMVPAHVPNTTAAEVVQSCLTPIGINVTVKPVDPTNFTQFKAAMEGYDMFIDYCSYRGALLYNFNRFMYRGGSSNMFGYESPEYEKMQDNVTAQTSWDDMLKEFAVLQQWVADNVPLFPLAYGNTWRALGKGVGGGYLGGSENAVDWSTLYKVVG